MELNIWLAYLLTQFLLSITPGPAVLLIASQGLRYGSSTSNFGAVGITSANLCYFILSAFGLGAILIEANSVFEIIKVAGAAYLIFVGFRMIIAGFNDKPNLKLSEEVMASTRREAFRNAFITQVSNPKAIIFFIALLPQFINPHGNIFLQFSIIAVTSVTMETLILMFYGWLCARGANTLKENKKVMKWIDRISGGILIGIGINLFFLKAN